MRSVGTYPQPIWDDLFARHNKPVYRHYHAMGYTLPSLIGLLHEHDKDVLFKPEFFERRESGAVGKTFVQVKGVAQWGGKEGVRLGFNVGTRGNGVDAAKWPEDLGTEIVA